MLHYVSLGRKGICAYEGSLNVGEKVHILDGKILGTISEVRLCCDGCMTIVLESGEKYPVWTAEAYEQMCHENACHC